MADDVDQVPEADREEQELPPTPDPRQGHVHPDDRPEADVLEQELPVTEPEPEPAPGMDAERREEGDWLVERREPEEAPDADWLEQHTEP